jgi:hypothetical protein
MANSIPKKRAKAEQLHKKRLQAASALSTGAKKPPRAPVPSRAEGPSAGRAEPLPAMRYPIKKVALGKPQGNGA